MPKGTRTGTEMVLQMTMIEILKRGPGEGVKLKRLPGKGDWYSDEEFGWWRFDKNTLVVYVATNDGVIRRDYYTRFTCEAYEVAKRMLMNSDGSQKE